MTYYLIPSELKEKKYIKKNILCFSHGAMVILYLIFFFFYNFLASHCIYYKLM